MARKPNYAFERNARAKAKAAKREAKRQAKLSAKVDRPPEDGDAPEATGDGEADAVTVAADDSQQPPTN